jgi:hypothetical protein
MKLAAFAFAWVLAGCAAPQPPGPQLPPPAPETAPGPGSAATAGQLGMGTPMPGGEMLGGSMNRSPGMRLGTMDAFALCNLSRQIGNARTPGERQALLDRVMPDMPPDERERHVNMMQQRCDGPANAAPGGSR